MSQSDFQIFSKVIKGEIHNVLSVMRADPRYASPLRFTSEIGGESLTSASTQMTSDGSSSSSSSFSSSWYEHPLLTSLRRLHDHLSALDVYNTASSTMTTQSNSNSNTDYNVSSKSNTNNRMMSCLTYLGPFCTAVSSRDMSAPITGAALSALHKFLVYGFIDNAPPPSINEVSRFQTGAHKNDYSRIRDAAEGITIVARCIRHCSFEETSSSLVDSGSSSSSNVFKVPTSSSPFFKTTNHHSSSEGGNIGLGRTFGWSKTKTKRPSPSAIYPNVSKLYYSSSSSTQNSFSSAYDATDEQVVLKLLSLGSLLLRSNPGRALLNDSDKIGVFDTVLHVAKRASDLGTATLLLRSAAEECLADIILVIFGQRSNDHIGLNKWWIHEGSPVESSEPRTTIYNHDNDDDDNDSKGSDDLWCCTDPASDIPDFDMKDCNSTQKNTTKSNECKSSDAAHDSLPPNNDKSHDSSSVTTTTTKHETKNVELENNGTGTTSNDNFEINGEKTSELNSDSAALEIMSRLTDLIDPYTNSYATCTISLRLINMALEIAEPSYLVSDPRLLAVLQDKLCRHLLRLSTTSDNVIFVQTLRVIFNLFNSIKDHLKIQLEVFLTSVHLRTLNNMNQMPSRTLSRSGVDVDHHLNGSSFSRIEAALESLLEFCREPALMRDLYLNYDCDVNCSNLFDNIVTTLARVASGKINDKQIQTNESDHIDLPHDNCNNSLNVAIDDEEKNDSPPLNIFNGLACEGVLAVIDSIASRCRYSVDGRGYELHEFDIMEQDKGYGNDSSLPIHNDSEPPLESDTNSDTTESHSIDSNRDQSSFPSSMSLPLPSSSLQCTREPSQRVFTSPPSSNELRLSEKVLKQRKRRKSSLSQVTASFNHKPTGKEWIGLAEKLSIFPTPKTSSSVADFLYKTKKLDKVQIGIYLSLGPAEKYPFHAKVLTDFASLFNFSGLKFSDSLRLFLSKFRLPGEAQCIDRLMEAFAKRLYEQQLQDQHEQHVTDEIDLSKAKTQAKSAIEKEETRFCDVESFEHRNDIIKSQSLDLLSTRDSSFNRPSTPQHTVCSDKPILPFKSSDAAFVLAFSTIMLNTDLHNPTIRDDCRMTLDQFIRNNRCINDGEDLPHEFLSDLYVEIKNNEIRMQAEISDVFNSDEAYITHLKHNEIDDTYADSKDNKNESVSSQNMMNSSGTNCNHEHNHWDKHVFSAYSEVETPFFTSYQEARQTFIRAGIHERDMFVSISPWALRGISTVFLGSHDDLLITKALKGMRQMADICVYFKMNDFFNQIIKMMIQWGYDYISMVMVLSNPDQADYSDEFAGRHLKDPEDVIRPSYAKKLFPSNLDEHDNYPIATIPPFSSPNNSSSDANNCDMDDQRHGEVLDSESHLHSIAGSASHRGLLALDVLFYLTKTHIGTMQEAWPSFIECIFALRDSNGLSLEMSDLDDFADSDGNVLVPSSFALRSRARASKFLNDKTFSFNDFTSNETSSIGKFLKFFHVSSGSNAKVGSASNEIDDFPSHINGADNDDYFNSSLMSMSVNPYTVSAAFSPELLSMSRAACIDKIFFDKRNLSLTKKIISTLLNKTVLHGVMENEMIFEHHAVFALELAARSLFLHKDLAYDLYDLFLSKFQSILCVKSEMNQKIDDIGNENSAGLGISNPYLMERAVVTILRACIHMYDIEQIRSSLKTSLLLVVDLPAFFLSHIADRLGCGMAIILKKFLRKIDSPDEWNLIGDLLDLSSKFKSGRQFVFDGIASCVDDELSSSYSQHVDTSKNYSGIKFNEGYISFEGASLFARLLLKFVFGSYGGDLTMSVPASFCLEKIYWYLHDLTTDHSVSPNDESNSKWLIDKESQVPDEDLWRSVCSAFYNVLLFNIPNSSERALSSLQKVIINTHVDSVSNSSWLDLLEMMATKQSQIALESARIKAFDFLCKTLLNVIPKIGQQNENLEHLCEILTITSRAAGENFRKGRNGSVSPLFENTLEILTNTTNVMSLEDFDGKSYISIFAVDIFSEELTKIGAAGGLAHMIAAKEAIK